MADIYKSIKRGLHVRLKSSVIYGILPLILGDYKSHAKGTNPRHDDA